MVNKHLITALGEIGQKEIAGNMDNPRISEYLFSVNMGSDDEIPWCAAFVNWCLEQSGFEGTKKPNAKSYLQWGYSITVPIIGAICVFDRGRQAWQGHTGFYMDETRSYIYLLGGNQENRVSIRPYKKDKLVGYRWYPGFE